MIINWEKLQEVPAKAIELNVGSYKDNVLFKVGKIRNSLSTKFNLCLVEIN